MMNTFIQLALSVNSASEIYIKYAKSWLDIYSVHYLNAPVVIRLKRDPYPSIVLGNLNETIISFSKIFSELLERTILLKVTAFGYWNNVNTNAKFIRGLILSIATTKIFIEGVGYFEPPESAKTILTYSNLATVFGATFFYLFWQERSSTYEKWKYLAAIYNDLLKAPPISMFEYGAKDKTFNFRNTLEQAFVQDLVQMEMWSHGSYYEMFEENLTSAIHYVVHQRKGTVSSDLRETYTKEACSYTKSKALAILLKYQQIIIEEESEIYKSKIYEVKRAR